MRGTIRAGHKLLLKITEVRKKKNASEPHYLFKANRALLSLLYLKYISALSGK